MFIYNDFFLCFYNFNFIYKVLNFLFILLIKIKIGKREKMLKSKLLLKSNNK